MPPISDADYAALLASEVPAPSDPVIKQFLAARDALRAEELKQRSDHSFRQSLSPIARRAHAIVARIRDEERRTIWTPELDETLAITAGGEGGSGGMTVYPGMAFSLAKGLMEGTRLWGIVRRLPKGGLLRMFFSRFFFVSGLGVEGGLLTSYRRAPRRHGRRGLPS